MLILNRKTLIKNIFKKTRRDQNSIAYVKISY